MADSQDDTAIMEDLKDLFAWNPPPFRLATPAMGGSLSTKTRGPAWYDRHLPSDRICKKVVHVKDLHVKVAAVVDEKLKSIRDRGITLQPCTAPGYVKKLVREERLERMKLPLENELSIQSYYQRITSDFCVPVASTLTLHPHIWKSVLVWWAVPVAQRDAVCDGSLRTLYYLDVPKREVDGRTKHNGPHYVDPALWQELMEVCHKYGDMAIWEMKSVSVGDGSLMLGIMALATGKEQFEWQLCKGGKDHKSRKSHDSPATIQLIDDPATTLKFGLEDPQSTAQANSDLALEVILDDALRRGGSSLQQVEEFDREMMQEANDEMQKNTKQKEKMVATMSSPKVGSGPATAALPNASQDEAASAKAPGFWNYPKSPFRKWSQDEQGSSSHTANSSSANPKSAPRKSLQDSTVNLSKNGTKKGKLNISIAPISMSFKLRRKPSQKRSPSKSPQKSTHTRKDQQSIDPNEDVQANPPPLSVQSVVQQAWAQGVRSQSTILIIHSGNYEYVCFRHRATQTLYVSDVLHVPFLKNPGYGKLQIGIYIAAVEDALGRHRLEKSLSAHVSPPDDPDGQDPGGKDHENSDDEDDEDDYFDDQHKSKRRRGRDEDGWSAPNSSVLDWAKWQAQSEHGLAIHLVYGVYNSIYPALFDRVGNRGTGRLDLLGLLTPPTSPPISPANSPPLSPPNLSSSTTKGREFLTLFLTSEIGLRTSGVLHGGIAEVNVGQQAASLKVTAKLAFVEDHQDKLFHELSVYNHLASKDVRGIPPVLGMFHNARDQGPYCLVLRDDGLSIHDRNDGSISISQTRQFDEMLKTIHEAGIVHGNLQLDNLLINDSGDVAIVDFDHARLSYDINEHERERQSLADLLKAVLPRSADHLDV